MSERVGHEAGGHGHHEEHDHAAAFVKVFIGLCVLTAMSFGVGNWDVTMSRPLVGWSLMMAISCAKALLVISFFMHLRWEANWKYVLTIPAAMMSLFLVLMLVPDVGLRTKRYAEERIRNAAEPTESHRADDHTAGGHSAGEHNQDEHVEH